MSGLEMSPRLVRAVAASSDVIALVDALGTILDVSPSVRTLTGTGPDELTGRTCFELMHPDDQLLAVDGLTVSLTHAGATSEPLRIRVADADGRWRPVEAIAVNRCHDPAVGGIVLTIRDRSGDEEVERRVQEREDRYRQIAELALEGVWYLDVGNRTTFVTQRLATLVGQHADDMIGRSVLDLVLEQDRMAVEELLVSRRRTSHEARSVRLVHRSGRTVWVRMSATPVHAPDGTRQGSIALVSDETEQHLAQQRLAATEAREEAILHALPDVLFRIDPDGRVTEHRSGRDDSSGLPIGEVRHLSDLVPADVVDLALETVHRAVSTGHVASFTFDVELDDALRSFEARMSSVGGDEVVALVRDVTEIRDAERSRQEYALEVQRRQAAEEKAELERGMARAARLEALGRLAGGIAHDMNNLLGVIANYAAAVHRSTREEATAADVVEIERVVRRGTQLTKRLLLFGRQDQATVEVQDLVAIAGGVGAMLRRTIDPNQHLELDLGDEPVHVVVDRWQLEQALINLVINAGDVAPTGTPIVLSVRGGPDAATVSVSDRGPGMSPEVQERAFEPFFTTKPPGSGTGLGLAVVHGVAVEAGGSVRIDSELDQGTTVTLVLPLHDGEGAAVGEPGDRAGDVTARLLVVDDEEDVRRSMARLLGSEGFDVVQADSGRHAIELLGSGLDVDLVLSDVAMPAMSGAELTGRLRELYPALPVVLVTGYGADHTDDLPSDVPVLGKPLAVDALLEVLRERVSPGAR